MKLDGVVCHTNGLRTQRRGLTEEELHSPCVNPADVPGADPLCDEHRPLPGPAVPNLPLSPAEPVPVRALPNNPAGEIQIPHLSDFTLPVVSDFWCVPRRGCLARGRGEETRCAFAEGLLKLLSPVKVHCKQGQGMAAIQSHLEL